MAAKPLLYTLGSATVGGFIELTYGSSLISSHGSQISAMTPAILIGTGFWALMHGFEVGKIRFIVDCCYLSLLMIVIEYN